MRMMYSQALEYATLICKIHGLELIYLTRDHPYRSITDQPDDSGYCCGDEVVIGECSRPELIVEIAAHECGHFAIREYHKKLHAATFAGSDSRYKTPEWCSIRFSIPIERAAWIYGWHLLRHLGLDMSWRGIWFAIKCMYGYRICYGGNTYRYERMSWLARRRVDLRAVAAIAFNTGAAVNYEYSGISEPFKKHMSSRHTESLEKVE